MEEINRSLCAQCAKDKTHKNTPFRTGPGYEAARKLWTQASTRPMQYREFLDLCHKCHSLAPFAFFNGNTFAVALQKCLEKLAKPLPSLEARMLLSTSTHYVAGAVNAKELESMCRHVDQLLSQTAK